jgi:two-component system CheB/CheR fusion protein
VHLPLAVSPVPESRAATSTTVMKSEPRRILIVDDNADARAMLHSVLGDAGHVLAMAGDGEEAVTIAAAFRPEVAVLDIGLPGMDGYELARILRASHPGVRLVALTGYGQATDLDAAAAAGFDAHCTKPIATAVLLDTIERPVGV